MTERMNEILGPGQVAVITGAAKGIGSALAKSLAKRGMGLALFDRDESALRAMVQTLETELLCVTGDVSNYADLLRLHDTTIDRFGSVQLLVNNAAINDRAGPWDDPQAWQEILNVDFISVLTMQHLFVPAMIEGNTPAAIVNLGSKEGITTPPGNAAYSVAKAGVKVLTEQLAHELRKTTSGRVSAHLLVPGYTWTPMNFPGIDSATQPKPEAPWSAEQVVDYFISRLIKEDFYILCPDNEVTPAMDARRILSAADDMIQNRPALSRWHPEYAERFEKWMTT